MFVSNFRRFHRLASYLSRYTNRPLGLALGASKLHEIFDESFYNENEGGLLGGLGQLFKNPARLYVYPSLNLETGQLLQGDDYPVPAHLRHLYAYLLENRFIEPIKTFKHEVLPIRSKDVLAKIESAEDGWEQLVPEAIVEVIKRQQLFGYGTLTAPRSPG